MSTQLTCTQIGTLSLAMVKHASLSELIQKIKDGAQSGMSGLKEGWEGMSDENKRTAIGGGVGAAGGGLLGLILSGRLGPTVTSALLGGGAGAAGGRYMPQILEMLGLGKKDSGPGEFVGPPWSDPRKRHESSDLIDNPVDLRAHNEAGMAKRRGETNQQRRDREKNVVKGVGYGNAPEGLLGAGPNPFTPVELTDEQKDLLAAHEMLKAQGAGPYGQTLGPRPNMSDPFEGQPSTRDAGGSGLVGSELNFRNPNQNPNDIGSRVSLAGF